MTENNSHECDFCPGTVQDIVARGEALFVHGKVVLVEGIVIGKCNRCGHRYWPADVLKRVERAAENPSEASRIDHVPVVAA